MRYKYFDIILGLFVAVLLISNIASTKILDLGPFIFDGGTILFPIIYIFGDILTEVYGYKAARRVIWTGFFSALLMSLVLVIVGNLPAAADWGFQESYDNILGLTSRIVIASMIAYFFGEFSNSYIMAKMKVYFQGKRLWLRTISSTIVGEGIDTSIFVLVAFYGVLPDSLLVSIIISNYIFKVSFETLATPLTYLITNKLKQKENIDVYDEKTNFNPFSLS
ncbi:MAG: queuosine precursor transporter [Candidatus Kerfeldbacteria bacterium]